MESNVFTIIGIIGNRMKGRRAGWSINGANNLASLLCKAHSTAEVDPDVLKKSALNELTHIKQSAENTPKVEGKDRDYPVKGTISPNLPEIWKIKWFPKLLQLKYSNDFASGFCPLLLDTYMRNILLDISQPLCYTVIREGRCNPFEQQI